MPPFSVELIVVAHSGRSTYRDKVTFDDGRPLFAEKIVVNDTFAVARMLSTPI